MASYGLEERFRSPRDCFRLNDPGAYSTCRGRKFKQNKCGFLSSAPRVTLKCNSLYTDNVYDARTQHFIPNATSLKDKTPRFVHKPFTEEELDEILCRCGIEKVCECPLGEERECQANVYKRLFKGPPPHSALGLGLSVPSKRDRGFEILHDGSIKRLIDLPTDQPPDFYDAQVHHFTDFFRGCKWSHWKAPRKEKSLEVRPGPADYDIEKKKTKDEICAEKVRAECRRKSKQLRFIELVQNKNIRENRPGPADYYPRLPKGTDLQYLGPKASRFLSSRYEKRPSPASHSVKRAFDLPEPPEQPCLAKLPLRAGFNVSGQRFKDHDQGIPGPGTYDAGVKLCRIVNCSKAPFGCSEIRFKEKPKDYDEDSVEDVLTKETLEEEEEEETCPEHTWPFKSKTKRFRSGETFDPYLPYITEQTVTRSPKLQQLAPFNISQVRFQDWFDWLPVHAGADTPGPAYYNWEKPRCLPAVRSGPLYRASRFKTNWFTTPAPNEYQIEGCVDTVLETHNQRLKQIVQKSRVPYKWTPKETRLLSPLERELIIINRAIQQLEIEPEKPDDSLLVLKAEDDTKRESVAIKAKRASEDKDGISETEEKRTSADKGEQIPTIKEPEKHLSDHKEEKHDSIDKKKDSSAETDKPPSKKESRTSIHKKEKHHSADKEVIILNTEEATKLLEKSEEDKNKKTDVVPPKKKLLRTFLYNHPTISYY